MVKKTTKPSITSIKKLTEEFNKLDLLPVPKLKKKRESRTIDSLEMPKGITADNTLAQDSFADGNPNYIDGLCMRDDLILDNRFQGYPQLAFYQQNGMVNTICNTLAQECTKKWIKFISISDSDKSEKIKQIELRFKQLKIKEYMKDAMYNTFAYGGTMMYPKLVNDDNELATELFIDSTKLGKGCLQYFKVIEPLYCSPLNYNSTNPLNESFYNPQHYNVMSQIIHRSRMIQFHHLKAPTLLKPMYRFFGIPLIQLVVPYIISFEEMKQNISDIVQRYNIDVLKTDIRQIISAKASPNSLFARMDLFNRCKSDDGTLAIDKNSEDYMQLQINVSGLDRLLSQAAEFICAIIKSPVTKIFGQPPSGFNANGENEIRNFYDTISEIQVNSLTNPLEVVLKLVQLDCFGEIDQDLSFEFNPLWMIDELERSQIQLNIAQRNSVNAATGAIDAQDIRTELQTDPNSGYEHLEDREPDQEEDYNLEEEEDTESTAEESDRGFR